MRGIIAWGVMLGLFGSTALGSPPDSSRAKQYEFNVYNQYDLRNSSSNALTVQSMLHDAFESHLLRRPNIVV
ncbi:MAG: hypothetical protein K9M49_03970 [Candidatus Marinimicrobia bacterium]|nr:hypothetical protein [Candidatus Neomarinimicrobiota bacterium]MCF7904291.1 hypothetical protein [Candidatus Neomarinimicrobiota bacterium]